MNLIWYRLALLLSVCSLYTSLHAKQTVSGLASKEAYSLRVKNIVILQRNGLHDSSLAACEKLYALAVTNEMKYFQGKARQLQANDYLIKGILDSVEPALSFALNIARSIDNQSLEGYSLLGLGRLRAEQGLPSKAIELVQTSLKLFKELNELEGLAIAEYEQGKILLHQGNWKNAIESFNSSLLYGKKAQNTYLQAMTLVGIGGMNERQNDLESATSIYIQAGEFFKELENNNGLAAVYTRLGNVAMGRANYTKAGEYYRKSIDMKMELGDQSAVCGDLYNISLIYEFTGKLDSAWMYADSAAAILKNITNNKLEVEITAQYGYLSYAKGDYINAINYGLEALELAQKIEYHTWIINCSELLSDAYKALNKYKEALEMQELYASANEKIFSEETQREVVRQQFKFDYEIKAIEDSILYAQREKLNNLELEKQEAILAKQQILLIGGGVAILIMTALVFFILKGKKRSDELLLNILPYEVAQELKNKGESEARAFDSVTVLFTDFKEFTETAEKLTAKELVNEINTCFKVFDEIIQRYNIEKIKTIGDAYMAAGGLHVTKTSEPNPVVSAALEMQDFMINRKNERSKAGFVAFEMRVGIHTGPVVAGIVGVKKFQYDIWGDTVNTASRMESNGEVGKVNISSATYKLINDDLQFAFESRGKIEVKGKGELEMYFVLKA